MKRWLFAAAALATQAAATPAPTPEARLATARQVARGAGERLWPGYGAAPFEMLLIHNDGETLLCSDRAVAGFGAPTREPATRCPARARPRGRLPGSLLAAMPIFGPPSTIVMGTPEGTGRTPADWTRTILHEHFHQWQAALPDYYARVAALDLAGGDETGMWMLDFGFPYADAGPGQAYAAASHALAAALTARGTRGFQSAAAQYLTKRQRFAAVAGERNWRYLDFQLWQEGVARWTEIELGKRYPDPAVRAEARALEQRTLAALAAPDLSTQKRELAYPLGAGEAMLLEACAPGWRSRYPRVLGLSALFAASTGCGATPRG